MPLMSVFVWERFQFSCVVVARAPFFVYRETVAGVVVNVSTPGIVSTLTRWLREGLTSPT